jgi:hypothetical protein
MGVLAILGRVLSTSQLGALPVPFSIFLGAGFHLLLGGWYFRNRARNAEGHPLGWRRAIEVMALTLVLFMATTFVLAMIVQILKRLT